MISNTTKHQQVINYMNSMKVVKDSNMPISSVLEIYVEVNAMEVQPFVIS